MASTQTLRGPRLLLRTPTPADASPLAAILAEPEVARWWRNTDAERDLLDRGLVIVHDGEVAGWVGWDEEETPDYRHAGIDLFLSAHLHGQGLGGEAIATLVDHLAGAHGHHRFTTDPAAANERAIHAFEAAGFRRVGTLQAYERGPDGRWYDGVLLELVRDSVAR